jgi:hypothetical protein
LVLSGFDDQSFCFRVELSDAAVSGLVVAVGSVYNQSPKHSHDKKTGKHLHRETSLIFTGCMKILAHADSQLKNCSRDSATNMGLKVFTVESVARKPPNSGVLTAGAGRL